MLNSAGKGSSALCLIDTFWGGVWGGFDLSSLQRPVLRLVPGQDVLAATTVLPHLGHLPTQRCVLPLQEGGAHRDLVLLQPPRITRALRCHVVLLSPGPVFVILGEREWKWMK